MEENEGKIEFNLSEEICRKQKESHKTLDVQLRTRTKGDETQKLLNLETKNFKKHFFTSEKNRFSVLRERL